MGRRSWSSFNEEDVLDVWAEIDDQAARQHELNRAQQDKLRQSTPEDARALARKIIRGEI